MVHQFFAWIDVQFEAQGLLPSSPFTSAMAYVRERLAALEVYLSDPLKKLPVWWGLIG